MKISKLKNLWHLPLLLAILVQFWPLIFMISTSFKDMNQIFQASLNPLPIPPTMVNYETVLNNFPFFTFLNNTLFIAILITVIKLVTSVLAAFAFV